MDYSRPAHEETGTTLKMVHRLILRAFEACMMRRWSSKYFSRIMRIIGRMFENTIVSAGLMVKACTVQEQLNVVHHVVHGGCMEGSLVD